MLILTMTALVAVSSVGPPPPPVDPNLQRLIQKYGTIRNATCGAVVAKAPTLDATASAAFMSEYQKFKGNGSEAAVIAAAAKLLADPELVKFFALPDSFTATGLDGMMVKCAVMMDALHGRGGSPKAELDGTMLATEAPAVAGNPPPSDLLAMFAVQGKEQEALVDEMLDNYTIMRDLLVAGGAIGGYYGEAYAIWTKIQSTSSLVQQTTASADMMWDDRSPENIFKRLALGCAAGIAQNITHRYARTLPNSSKFVDPVARYLHFEKYYKAGDLDPAFPVLTAFELTHTVDADSTDDDMIWLRTALPSFRPDDVGMSPHWRYAESVHTEVAYGDSQCSKWPGVCNGHYSDIPVGGDVCGGRAFWGRFSRKGFGVPTWGATEHAHAAMSSWNPTGWSVMLGAPWPDCWWGNRGGQDFYLETQARENRSEFQSVLRGGWVAKAKDETPVDMRWTTQSYSNNNGIGGLWSALMLYYKKSIAVESQPMNRTVPVVPGIDNKVANYLERIKTPAPPPPPPKIASDGSITITAVSYTSKNRSAPVHPLQMFFEDGQQLISNGCSSSVGPPCFYPMSSALYYNFTSNMAGDFYLTLNFSTFHMNQDLFVSVNGAKEVEMGMFYTVGWWNLTQPIKVTLNKGPNMLTFTRTSGRDVAFKEFVLSVKEPIVPKPNGNFTPVPAPPSPPPGAYIEVPADTTCVKQGIQPVSERDCSHACLALGFKSTGDRSRPNMSGCFVMTEGQYAGNCNYNTNTSATCTPPCTLYGSITRALCVRQ